MNEKIDIYFIAQKAKVSPSTVSRVFNRPEVVKKKTREKVQDICKRYNYHPSVVASSMRTNKTKYIGIVLPLINPFYSELLKGAEKFASQNDYYIVLFNSEDSYEKELIFLDAIFKRRIDGIIISGIAGGKKDNFFVKEIIKKEIPCVLVDRYIEGIRIPSVTTNNYMGGEIAAEYLLKNKHKKIGIITSDLKIKIFKDRYNGFKNRLNQDNTDEEFLIEIPMNESNILNNLSNNKDVILSKKIDAVFCTTDLIAINLIEFLKINDVGVPEEVSVIGFDNIPAVKFIEPKLTTIAQDISNMGMLSVKLILEILNRPKTRSKSIVLKPKLVIRDSVKEK